MLTVRDSEADKVAALDAGADDYVTKPFKHARAAGADSRGAAPHRRGRSGRPRPRSDARATSRSISTPGRCVAAGRRVRLTPKEFDLLRYLASHANKVVSHREMLQAVWGPDYGDQVDYLRVIVNQLRKKIEPQPSKPVYLAHRAMGWLSARRCRPSRAQPALRKS